MKGRMLYLLLVVSLVVGFATPVLAEEPQGEPIRIGLATEVTGKAAMSGDHAVKGGDLAVKEINAAGGVLGRPIELVIEDTQSTNPGAIAAYNKLVQEDDVVAVIAPIRSTQIQSMDPMIRESGFVTLMGGTNTGLTETGNQWLFRFRPPDKYAGKAMVEYLVEELGLSKIGIIHDTDAFGSGGADVVEAALKDKGLEATTRQQYTTGDKDYAAQILTIKNAGSEAVVIYGTNSEDDAIILRTIKDLVPGLVIMGSPSNVAQVTIDLGGDAVEGIYSVTDFFEDAGPTTQAFVKNYGEAYEGAKPDLYASWIYDAVYGLANAITAVGSPDDPAAMREAMFTLQDIPSAEGVVNCAPNGDCAHTYYVVQVEQAKPKLITPINFWAPAAASDSEVAPIAQVETEKQLRIVYIPKNTGNPYFDSIINGFKKAGEELGYEFTTVAPSTAEGTGQIPFIKEQVQRGVDAIAISPNDPDAVVPALKQAMDRGIRVVCVNSDMNKEGREVAVLPMDFEITGSSQVELLGSVINYEGEIAILSATTTAPDQNYWIEGMKEALKDPKYAKMNLVKIAYGDDDPQKSLTEAEALLTGFPNLRGIISPTTVGVAAAAQAVETAGAADRVQVVGLGTPNQMRRFLKNGTITAFALWSPYDEGYLSGYMMYGMLTGQVAPEPGGKFVVPELGEREFLADNVVITGPPTVFTIDNIDNFDF